MICDLPRRNLLGAALSTMVAGTVSAVSAEPDPILAAIQAVRVTSAALTAALNGLNEDDPVQMRRADEAADRDADARNALGKARPTTQAGFHALIRFHAEDVTWMEPDTFGALALRDLAEALEIFSQTGAYIAPAASMSQMPASRHGALQETRQPSLKDCRTC